MRALMQDPEERGQQWVQLGLICWEILRQICTIRSWRIISIYYINHYIFDVILISTCLTLPLQETKYFLTKVFRYQTTFRPFRPICRILYRQSIEYKYSHRKTSSELVLVFPCSSWILRILAVNVLDIMSCPHFFILIFVRYYMVL